MATLERYSSFEEMDEAQIRDNKNVSKEVAEKNHLMWKEFCELLRQNLVPAEKRKKPNQKIRPKK